MHRLHIRLLGDFQLVYADEVLTSVNSPRLQALLAYLVLHRAAPVLRQYVAFQFWPDSAEGQARTNLRKLFFQLQRTLPAADRLLVADPQTIGWQTQAPFTLDVAELQQALAQLNNDPLDLDALRQVVELYQGPLLPSCYDDWIAPLRQQLHDAVMEALERLLTLLENQRAYETGIRYARRLLTFDPLAEKSYQRLMRLYALQGDFNGALRVYQDCSAVLRRELAVEPAAETQALYAELCQHNSTLIAKTAPQRPQAKLLPLIGRQQEWQILQETWRRTARGQSHFVCLWGEAGIGKTRLGEELLDWAGRQGILAVHTRAYQAQETLAYAPVTTLLRSPALTPRLVKLSPQWLCEVARLLPELLEQHPNLPTPQPMGESWQRQRFFEALARALLTDQQPLLLVFDDLHWADQETLLWLHYLLHFAPQARLLVVGTSRVEEVGPDHPLMALRQSLQREGIASAIDLTPLTAAEVTTLAQTVADQQLTHAQTQQLYTDTEGNPLFVVETVRAGLGQPTEPPLPVLAPGEAASAKIRQRFLPPKVYDVIQARLRQLSPPAQKIASLAAVIGRSFSFAVLMAAAQGNEDALIDHLEELVERRILREQGMDGYDFSHDRIRDVAYAELSQARRRQIHRQVAAALETVYADNVDAISGALADHYLQLGNHTKVVHYLQRAGAWAAAHFANRSAIEHFTRALNLLPATHYGERFPLLLAREQLFDLHGDSEAQRQDLTALQQAVDEFAGEQAQNNRRQATIAIRWSYYQQRIGDNGAALRSVQQAVAGAQRCGALDLEAEAYHRWGNIYFIQGNLQAARPHLEQALLKARAAGYARVEAQALELLSATGMYSGMMTGALLDYLRQGLTIFERTHDLRGQASIHNKIGYVHVAHGENGYEQAKKHYDLSIQLARQIGDRAIEQGVLRNLGIVYICQGDYWQAEAILAQASNLAMAIANPTGKALTLVYMATSMFNRGDYQRTQCYLEEALHLFGQAESRQWQNKALIVMSLLYHYQGQQAAALTYGQQALQAAEERGDSRLAGCASTCIGHAFAGLGSYAAAAAAYQRAAAFHRQTAQTNRSLEPLAGLAQIALLVGQLDQAQQVVTEILAHLATNALDQTEEAFQVYWICYQILHTQGDQRAPALLRMAYTQLQSRAANIDDPQAQRFFWALPRHQAVQQAIGQGMSR